MDQAPQRATESPVGRHPRTGKTRSAVIAVAVLLALGGDAPAPAPVAARTGGSDARAGGAESPMEARSGAADRQAPSPLLVLAAASLTDVLPQIGAAWEASAARAGVAVPEVRFSFDATSRIAPQAASGAPADVFLSADEAWIEWLRERHLLVAGTERAFAANELVFVVPAGREPPAAPADLDGLRRIAVGGENVPAGRYAREALARIGVLDAVGERLITGGSVRGVLEWVARGEVDGGVVYRTDALAEPGVEVAFAFPPETHPPIRYWAAVLTSSRSPGAAAEFVEYLATEGATALSAAGFLSVDAVPTRAGLPSTDTPAPDPGATTGQHPTSGGGLSGAAPSIGSAIRLSLLVAFFATVLGVAPAVGLGWLLARHDFRGKTLVSTLVLAPLVMPPVVTGFLLLSLLGSQGALGSMLSSMGLSVPFTLLGATIAAFVVGLPLYVLSVRGAFEAVDPLYEELSWTLGVPPRRTFLRISLPLALPGIAAGAILAFARALGEFGATVVLAGNVEGSTRTIALAVYTLLEAPSGREATWTLVGASVALSLLALVGFEALSRRQRRRLREDHGV